MLPHASRLHRRADFGRVLRGGARAGRPELVVHLVLGPGREPGEPSAPPRAGFAVSKAVGNSVVRHRVVRRLRAQAAPLLADLPAGSLVVVRALPPAADCDSARLGAALRSAWDSAARKAAAQGVLA